MCVVYAAVFVMVELVEGSTRGWGVVSQGALLRLSSKHEENINNPFSDDLPHLAYQNLIIIIIIICKIYYINRINNICHAIHACIIIVIMINTEAVFNGCM